MTANTRIAFSKPKVFTLLYTDAAERMSLDVFLEELVLENASAIEEALLQGQTYYDIAFDLAQFGIPIVVSDLRECHQRLTATARNKQFAQETPQ